MEWTDPVIVFLNGQTWDMKSWPRPEPVEQLGPNVRMPGLAWGTNVGDRTLGQGSGQGLAMVMARPWPRWPKFFIFSWAWRSVRVRL